MSLTKSPCGLDELQVKIAKANYSYSKTKSPQNFRKQEKTSKKMCKQEIAKPKQNKRYDKTWRRI